METGRLKQGAAGDAPGGGRRRVRRFAPRLPVTCPRLQPLVPSPGPRGTLFRSVSSFFFLFSEGEGRRLRYFGTFVRPRHNKW